MARGKRLIIGLGNPGAEYDGTRHNIGFAVVDRLAEQARAPAFALEKGNALVTWGRLRGNPVGLAKPQTYMNRSGSAVRALVGRYGLTPQDVLVVVDDISLPVGRLRLRPGGSAGGHNGLQDVIDALGTDAYTRLRFGIGSDFARGRQADYVLSPFAPDEQEAVEEGLARAAEAALTFVREGLATAMNRFN